ncbi:DUF1349 domain-containing protein [Kineosporia mesophila]|uniref:DUF1349 domain-containing protein n=1 Tax=Kineosporia mesophila TaxID=566012 RepID=A0ABP7AUI4_9ACTN|nr:DUF1349 domain-containing protein [Kineosporia mesophila]MCD5352402.1 DUF1349 domain-containing protein [Kineosporia mesophila]
MTPDAPSKPFRLVPSPGSDWNLEPGGGSISTTAHPRSDVFVDPAGVAAPKHDAVTLLAPAPEGDFQLSARVTVDFAADFDAGVLVLWFDETHWGKLCFEYSPAGEPMVVSVVCRGVADDSNAFAVAGDAVWLRASRIDGAFAYHASLDGKTWPMVRYFAIPEGSPADLRIGFLAQSPVGEGCRVTFDEVAFTDVRLENLRDGS